MAADIDTTSRLRERAAARRFPADVREHMRIDAERELNRAAGGL
jgi:hypothetical protein